MGVNKMMRLALLSVSDKTGIVELGQKLVKSNYMILSTGGTYKTLAEGLDGTDNLLQVSEYTGYPETEGGLVKTLHPKIHAGLLMNDRNPKEFKDMLRIGAFPIDFVAVNLYPFKKTIEKEGCTFEQAVENIDIGGPTMLRGAAKGMLRNGRPFAVIDPSKYDKALHMLNIHYNTAVGLEETLGFRRELAGEIYSHTTDYDNVIAPYIRG